MSMNIRKIDLNLLILLVLFLISYFYYDSITLNKIAAFTVIGIFIALCAYILYGLSYKMWFKTVLLVVISFFFFLLPGFIVSRAGKRTIDDRFYGSWTTDSTDGYSVKLNVYADSVFLSQSNLPLTKGYKLSVSNDTLILTNVRLNREYKWKYTFIKDSTLMLYNSKDSLLLRKNG